jgi:hypothetical protein
VDTTKKTITYGNYTATQSGNVMGYRKGKTIQDYRDLANAMSMGAQSNYPVGLSPCFTAGINGDWDEDGICPVSKIDRDECTCDDEFKMPEEQ